MLVFRTLSKHIYNGFRVGRGTFLTSTYKDLEIPKITVAELFFRHASIFRDNIAYIDDTRNISYSYSDVKRCIQGIASALTKKGVSAGTMVAIVASNSPEYIMLTMALSSMGCSVALCNQNQTKTEMKYQLTDSNPSIIFTDNENLDMITQVAPQIHSIQDIYLIGEPSSSYGSVQNLMEDSGNMSPIGQVDIDVDNHVAIIPYSSGTTGLPKGVMITHTNLVSNMLQLGPAYEIGARKTMLLALPLYHIYGSVIIPTMGFISGSTVIVQPKFDPIRFLTAIEKYKVGLLHLVPPQILFFINHPEVAQYDLSSVLKCLCGSAPLDANVERRFVEKFSVHQPTFNLHQGYGLTETSPLTHVMPYCSYDKRGSVGLLIPNMKCKIVDVSTKQELGANQDGELLLKGPNIMKGYFGRLDATQEAFIDGWFCTGDKMRYDDDQYFYVSDRIKDIIKVKGMQVAPAEVEGILLSHPAISDCAVIGVPHERFGEAPKAFIVKCKEVIEKEIHQYVEEHLSPHKHLHGGIVFIDKIPKSPSGKILRRLLK